MEITTKEIIDGVRFTMNALNGLAYTEEIALPKCDYMKTIPQDTARKISKMFYADCGGRLSKALKRYYFYKDISSVTLCVSAKGGDIGDKMIYQEGVPAPMYNFEVYMKDERCYVLDPKISRRVTTLEEYLLALAGLSNLSLENMIFITTALFQLNIIYKYSDVTNFGKIIKYVDENSGMESIYKTTYIKYLHLLEEHGMLRDTKNIKYIKLKLVHLAIDNIFRDSLRDIFDGDKCKVFDDLEKLRTLWSSEEQLTYRVKEMFDKDCVIGVTR